MQQRTGGRYVVDETGKAVLAEEPTKSHPEGDAPRDAEGNRLDRPAAPAPAPATKSRKS